MVDDLLVAHGVRYARAPRFAPPVPVPFDPVSVRSSVQQRGPACPQRPSRLDGVTGPLVDGLEQDEECLTLSVRAPVPDGRPRPVVVWLHGGAHVSGAAEAPAYDLGALARDGDLVAVGVTHRLGVLGYLGLDGLVPANLGLLDQLTALRWVRANVAAFGGDPARVTLMGQSAGADSVLAVLAADGSEGLVQRAIVQSAPIGLRHDRGGRRAAMTAAMAERARAVLPAGVDELRRVPVERLLALEDELAAVAAGAGLHGSMPFGPVYGQHPLPDVAGARVRWRRLAPGTDLMAGRTRDDAAPFVRMNPRFRRAAGAVPLLERPLLRIATAAVNRRLFSERRLARLWRSAGGRVRTYRFGWRPAGGPFGACHCLELPFLLGTAGSWSAAPMLGPHAAPAIAEHGPPMRRYWADFVRHGTGGTAPVPLPLHSPRPGPSLRRTARPTGPG